MSLNFDSIPFDTNFNSASFFKTRDAELNFNRYSISTANSINIYKKILNLFNLNRTDKNYSMNFLNRKYTNSAKNYTSSVLYGKYIYTADVHLDNQRFGSSININQYGFSYNKSISNIIFFTGSINSDRNTNSYNKNINYFVKKTTYGYINFGDYNHLSSDRIVTLVNDDLFKHGRGAIREYKIKDFNYFTLNQYRTIDICKSILYTNQETVRQIFANRLYNFDTITQNREAILSEVPIQYNQETQKQIFANRLYNFDTINQDRIAILSEVPIQYNQETQKQIFANRLYNFDTITQNREAVISEVPMQYNKLSSSMNISSNIYSYTMINGIKQIYIDNSGIINFKFNQIFENEDKNYIKIETDTITVPTSSNIKEYNNDIKLNFVPSSLQTYFGNFTNKSIGSNIQNYNKTLKLEKVIYNFKLIEVNRTANIVIPNMHETGTIITLKIYGRLNSYIENTDDSTYGRIF